MTSRRGWIAASARDRLELEAMGIQLGPYRDGYFEECVVNEEAMGKLDRHWGKFSWWLDVVEGEP